MTGDTLNILLVDDKQENIYSLQSLLDHETQGINFLHATSGKEALKISLKENIALILMDVQMPEMDGYETVHLLKQNRSTENIPVIFVTAINQEASSVLEGYSKGAFDYLFKPLNPAITRAKVQAFIKMYEQQKINENLATLVNNAQDLMCIIEPKGLDILIANPAWQTELGYSNDQVEHTSFTDYVVHREDIIKLRAAFESAVTSKNYKYSNEMEIRCLSEAPKWICWNFVYKNHKWYGCGMDITARKKVEKELNETNTELKKANEDIVNLNNDLEIRVTVRTKELTVSRDRFEAVARATNDTLWDWNLLTNEIWWSEGFKNMFGYDADELSLGIDSKFNKIHPDDADKVMETMQQLIQSGQSQWSGEYRFQKADGTYAFILDRLCVLTDEGGMPYRIVGSMFDLTEIRHTQHQLDLINKELINKNGELKRINRDMDNFIYTASHDLKAPVSNIEGLISSLDDTIDTSVKNEMYSRIVDMIHLSIERFKNTLRDLSEVAKADGGEVKHIEETSLAEMVEEVKAHISRDIEESSASIVYDFSEEPTLSFSRKNLRSILYNLISNAIKYHAKNRVPEVVITSQNYDEEYTLVTVRDNGLGIREEDKEKVFTMFKRLHNHVEGTGVGMSIVKRIIDNSGGRIELDSEVGKGSIFKVYFKKNLVKS